MQIENLKINCRKRLKFLKTLKAHLENLDQLGDLGGLGGLDDLGGRERSATLRNSSAALRRATPPACGAMTHCSSDDLKEPIRFRRQL